MPKVRIHGEAGSRMQGCLEAELQDIIYENARLLQVRIKIVQAVVHGPRRHRLDDFGDWAEHRLICLQDLAICLFVGIVDR